MKNNNHVSRTKQLIECSILISIATVLSIIKILELPYGGTITFASFLPMIIISYRHGVFWGFGSGLAFSIIQQLLGINNFSFVTSWKSVIAVVLLDYIFAFSFVGLGGIFKKIVKKQNIALVGGALLVSVIRYACHVISGATVWVGISIPTQAALIYSLIYNATYMIPETIILLMSTLYLGTVLDFSKKALQKSTSFRSKKSDIFSLISGIIGIMAISINVSIIFYNLQDPESGYFNISLLATERFVGSFWMTISIVSLISAVIIAVLLFLRRYIRKKRSLHE